MNIASLVVRVRPERRQHVEGELGRMPGVEIAWSGAAGPLIVTVEDTPEMRAIDSISAIHGMPGVIAAGLSFHYTDDMTEHARDAREIQP